MKKIVTSLVAILFVNSCPAQTTPGLTYFHLPVTAEKEYLPVDAFVAIRYFGTDSAKLKNYTGTNKEITMLSSIFSYIYSDNKAAFMKASDKADTMAKGVFEFYKYFVSHSKDPTLLYQAQVGIYNVFFVRLELGYPLMTFCLENNAGHLLNNPQVLQHPAVVALTEAVNKMYLFPGKFQPQNTIPAANKVISFDSAFKDPAKGLAFYCNIERIKYNISDTADTANHYNAAYTPALNFYRQTIAALVAGNMEKYYSMLATDISVALKKSFKMTGSEKESIEHYKQYESYQRNVNGILNMGDIKIIFVADTSGSNLNAAQKNYLLQTNNKMEWLNSEYYLDVLLATKEFKRVLIE